MEGLGSEYFKEDGVVGGTPGAGVAGELGLHGVQGQPRPWGWAWGRPWGGALIPGGSKARAAGRG